VVAVTVVTVVAVTVVTVVAVTVVAVTVMLGVVDSILVHFHLLRTPFSLS
jgi:hypothetical protein